MHATSEDAAPLKMKTSSQGQSSVSPSFVKVQGKSPLQALQHLINRQRTMSNDELDLHYNQIFKRPKTDASDARTLEEDLS